MSFYLYIKGRFALLDTGHSRRLRGGLCFLASLVLWFLAMGSKEIAITLPFLIIVFEFLLLQNIPGMKISPKVFVLFLSSLILLASIPVMLYNDYESVFKLIGKVMTYNHLDENITVWERLLTESRIVFYYISLLVLPLPGRQMLIYSYPVSSSLVEPVTTIISISGIVALLCTAFLLRKKRPLVSFFILWYFANLALESTFINLHLVFEHRLYLPSVAVFACIVMWFAGIVKPENGCSSPLLLFGRSVKTAVFYIVLLCMLVLTYRRNHIWRNEVSLYEDNVKKNQSSIVLFINMGRAYEEAKRFDEALDYYSKAVKIKPGYYKPYFNRGAIYLQTRDYAKAIKELTVAADLQETIIAINLEKGIRPYNKAYQVFHNLAYAYSMVGETDLSIKVYERALELNPDHIQAYYRLGDLYIEKHDYDKARHYFAVANRMEPYDPEGLYKLGVVFSFGLGNKQEGIRYFRLFLENAGSLPDSDDRLRRVKDYLAQEVVR